MRWHKHLPTGKVAGRLLGLPPLSRIAGHFHDPDRPARRLAAQKLQHASPVRDPALVERSRLVCHPPQRGPDLTVRVNASKELRKRSRVRVQNYVARAAYRNRDEFTLKRWPSFDTTIVPKLVAPVGRDDKRDVPALQSLDLCVELLVDGSRAGMADYEQPWSRRRG